MGGLIFFFFTCLMHFGCDCAPQFSSEGDDGDEEGEMKWQKCLLLLSSVAAAAILFAFPIRASGSNAHDDGIIS